MMESIPRTEHPFPQFVRETWINLNGEWDFEIDYGHTGREQKYFRRDDFRGKIKVPFCPESELSGVGHLEFMTSVWYRRTFELPDSYKDKKVILHFGAVDYKAYVYVNGTLVGNHIGGYSSFSFDITNYLTDSTNTVVVNAEDNLRGDYQPSGKQSKKYASYGCKYTRVTGIWQTVWLEAVGSTYVRSTKYLPNASDSSVVIEGVLEGSVFGKTLKVTASYLGTVVGEKKLELTSKHFAISLPLSIKKLWDVGKPELYDLDFEICEGTHMIDQVRSYFGLRDLELTDDGLYINGKPVFQRLILDQGMYRKGIYTAPTDEDLKKDIEIGMRYGFNGARAHQKIFEPRYLYWADQLGYLVWGEQASWGMDHSKAENLKYFLPEWIEGVERDFNHPSIIGWCPMNENWDHFNPDHSRQDDGLVSTIYEVTKAMDKTRPVIDTSGNFHVITDIYDVHDYEQNHEKFDDCYGQVVDNQLYERFPDRQTYKGGPIFMSEYGGIQWDVNNTKFTWGYGSNPTSVEAYLERYVHLTNTLLDNQRICAFCYTQLCDVEQEVNGLVTYDREDKFTEDVIEAIRKTNLRPAAFEELKRS